MRGMPEVGLGRMEWASEAWFQATNHAESSFHPGATWWQTDRGAMARGRMAMAKPPGIAGHSPSAHRQNTWFANRDGIESLSCIGHQ